MDNPIKSIAKPKVNRDIASIAADLTKAATHIQNKKMELDRANLAASNASKEYDDAQIAAAEYRRELDEMLNLLVPQSMQGRIRQSA